MKLIFCNIKLGVLCIFTYLWMLSPLFACLYLSKIKLSALGYVLGWMCLIMFYFNITHSNRITNKWFDKLYSEKKELRYAILEGKNLITEVGNIKIIPFGKS